METMPKGMTPETWEALTPQAKRAMVAVAELDDDAPPCPECGTPPGYSCAPAYDA